MLIAAEDAKRRYFSRNRPPSPWTDPAPILSELFGIERLEDHARSLAAIQPITRATVAGVRMADRLAANAAFLLHASRALAPEGGGRKEFTPAAEWLIDNYHLVELQIREIGIDLPPGFYAQLPKLAAEPFSSLARVFGAISSLVAPTDSHIDFEVIRRYLVAYQSGQALTIGEPACGRMAVITPMLRPGQCWRPRHWVTRTG